MALDPYETLGVPKGADKATIRRAYRRRSKKAHPDGGGTAKEFALVKLSHDILTDEERRAKYDATGDVHETQPDNTLSEILKMVSIALDVAMQKAHETGSLDYLNNKDLLGSIRGELKDFASTSRKVAADMAIGLKANEKLLNKFKRKDGSRELNLLQAMIVARVGDMKEAIEKQAQQQEKVTKTLAFLDDYEFEIDKLTPDENARASQRILQNAFSGFRF